MLPPQPAFPAWIYGRSVPAIITPTQKAGRSKEAPPDFDDKVWYKTLSKTLYMEELIRRHGAIMDKYDPKKEIGLIVDEWGTWSP